MIHNTKEMMANGSKILGYAPISKGNIITFLKEGYNSDLNSMKYSLGRVRAVLKKFESSPQGKNSLGRSRKRRYEEEEEDGTLQGRAKKPYTSTVLQEIDYVFDENDDDLLLN